MFQIPERHLIALLVCLAFLSPDLSAVAEQKQAKAMTVKIGYFDLATVKSKVPEDSNAKKARYEADRELRDTVNKFNDDLKKMIAEGRPKVEINEFIRQKTEELRPRGCGPLRQSFRELAAQKIIQAVNSVAKKKGLDLVVDSANNSVGKSEVLRHGVDITSEVMKELGCDSDG
jgi:Skp family chaperone for outer membrane proteins